LRGGFLASAALADEAAQIYDPEQVFFVNLIVSPTGKGETGNRTGQIRKRDLRNDEIR